MTFIPVFNGVELQVFYGYSNQSFSNTLNYAVTLPVTSLALNDLLDDWEAFLAARFVAQLSSNAQVTGVRARDISSQTGLIIERTLTPPIQGLAGGESLPYQIAATLSLRTAQSGRIGRGRLYFGGLTIAQINGNDLEPAAVADWIDMFDDWKVTAGSQGFTWSVASRFFNGQPRVQGVTFPITSTSMDSTPRTQRRRQVP